MTAELDDDAQLKIGHVLFIDIVGFSKLLVEEQSKCTQHLNQLVRNSDQFRVAESPDKLFRLPTGDGMVLVFFTGPEAPVRCAVETAKALKECPDFGVRMGIHSGPVNKISDVNDRSNLAGGGINIAQRIMDCGDAGHILLSKRLAEDLEQHGKWRPYLHDLGECEVKHGLRVNLVNLYNGEVGNPAIPEKVICAKQERDVTERALVVRRRKKIGLVAGAVMAILAVASGLWISSTRHAPMARRVVTALRIESLAVKPLDNFSGDPNQNYFADGMTDELITKLSHISALQRVISRSTMMKYKLSPKSALEIARELGVAAVVEGSVVLSGNQARISARLIEVAADKNLWAESYTRDIANIVSLQNEVALAIARAVELKLTPGEKARLGSARRVNPEAYDYYLRGKGSLGGDKEATDSKIAMLEKSVSLDDTFAEAWAQLSIAYSSKGYFIEAGKKEWDVKAEEALAKALLLDPELPVALLARAQRLWRPSSGFQHEKAMAEAKRALEITPNFADAHVFLGAIYFHVGLLDAALQEFKTADAIDPGNSIGKFHIGVVALLQGRYNDAYLAMVDTPTAMFHAMVESSIANALFFAGRKDDAKRRIDDAKTNFKDEGGLLASTEAIFLAAAGDKVHAHEKIDEALKLGEGFGHFHHTAYMIASAYALMDEPDSAMKWIAYSAENGYPNLTWFERDPNLSKLRKNPRFISFLEKLKPRFQRLKALAGSSLPVSK
jgi:TolB-like protein/class 3 adenylate cyclase/cytochrome c-type biogenesis protein CcmH/NrfG